ncbi:MAG: hypothetical protein WKG00_32710 [Polyangiaceae bacterium]
MLSRETMGVLALAILWVNTLLVVGAALQEAARLWRLRVRWGGSGLAGRALVGRVAHAEGPGGALAMHRVEQVGRYAADDGGRRAILFADKSYRGEAFAGVVTTGAGEVRVAPGDAEVWAAPAAIREATRRPDGGFDGAYADARKARGYDRMVEVPVRAGAEVWLVGALRDAGDGKVLGPGPDGLLLVSAVDPRRLCARKLALVALFVAGVLLAACGCTALALWPPYFGTVSTIGGVLGLAYFLLVQPAGTALRDAVRVPARAAVRGTWVEGAAEPSEVRPRHA